MPYNLMRQGFVKNTVVFHHPFLEILESGMVGKPIKQSNPKRRRREGSCFWPMGWIYRANAGMPSS